MGDKNEPCKKCGSWLSIGIGHPPDYCREQFLLRDITRLKLRIDGALFLLGRFEMHCPCGARPETPFTHPHVTGCLIGEAIEKLQGAGPLP